MNLTRSERQWLQYNVPDEPLMSDGFTPGVVYVPKHIYYTAGIDLTDTG